MTENELQHGARRRLAVIRHAQEVSHNVQKTCRYYGISRSCYYRWLARYNAEGEAGLRERSRGPHHSPTATSDEVVAKILYLRQHYHFGPQKIAMYLARYHDIEVSTSGVWRILKKAGLNRLPRSQRYQPHAKRWKRYEMPQPGHQVQIDVKFVAPIAGVTNKRYYQYTAIDDCTRLRILKIFERNNQRSAIQFLDYVCERLPFRVDRVQTDNGAEFQKEFHWHVLDKGVSHVYIKPRTPRLNGKVERSHRIDKDEFYALLRGVVIDSSKLFNEKIREWEHFYNYDRPHGALSGQTPYERFKQKTSNEEPSVTENRQSYTGGRGGT